MIPSRCLTQGPRSQAPAGDLESALRLPSGPGSQLSSQTFPRCIRGQCWVPPGQALPSDGFTLPRLPLSAVPHPSVPASFLSILCSPVHFFSFFLLLNALTPPFLPYSSQLLCLVFTPLAIFLFSKSTVLGFRFKAKCLSGYTSLPGLFLMGLVFSPRAPVK